MKKYVLHSEKHKQACINFIQRLSLEVLYQVDIGEYEKKRTLEQNSRYWPLLQLVADNLGKGNHSKEWWHYKLRCEWGYVVGTCKVRVEGVGLVDAPMPKSTTDMSTHEMAEYQEKITELLIENAVQLPEWV